MKINIEGLGISMISKKKEEILYATFKNVEFTYRETNLYHTFLFIVKWLQVDNQLYGSLYPVFMYPKKPSKNTNGTTNPVFQTALVHSKDTSISNQFFI